MKNIPLNRGLFALVDDEDCELVSQYRWTVSLKDGKLYPKTSKRANGKITYIYLHRLIMNPDKGTIVDHKDRNTLDNRKCNLRLCTWADNMRNRAKAKTNRYGYKGVEYCRSSGHAIRPWRAKIGFERKTIHIGYYGTKEQAALAYNIKAEELFGEFACLNTIQPNAEA